MRIHMSDKVKKYSIAILKYIILIFVAFVVIYPLIGVFLASFKTKIEYLSTGSMELPENFKNFSNYATVMINDKACDYSKNHSILVAREKQKAVLAK